MGFRFLLVPVLVAASGLAVVLLSGCGRCESWPMPSDSTYVEGCGCVANPDLGHARSYGCGGRSYTPSPSRAPDGDARDAGDDAADAATGGDAGVVGADADGGADDEPDAGEP